MTALLRFISYYTSHLVPNINHLHLANAARLTMSYALRKPEERNCYSVCFATTYANNNKCTTLMKKAIANDNNVGLPMDLWSSQSQNNPISKF